jgi:hypothetical protein
MGVRFMIRRLRLEADDGAALHSSWCLLNRSPNVSPVGARWLISYFLP